MKIKDFVGKGPVLLPEVFLAGKLDGWGIMESPLGNLKRRYSINAVGVANGDYLSFIETWSFDDGFSDTLKWKITKQAAGLYFGQEDYVVGHAEGDQAGCAFHWTYTRNTPQPNGKTIKLSFNDWFFQIDERTLIVRGSATKFGLPIARAYVTYRRQ